MILENPPPDAANAEQDQASETTPPPAAATALRRHLADSPDRETARPHTTLSGVEPHYLFQSGRLLADLYAGDPQAEARKEVERAIDYEAALPPGSVTGDDRPLHLQAWGRVLQ